MDFEYFCGLFEKLMNSHVDKIKKMVHYIYVSIIRFIKYRTIMMIGVSVS
jgi:hypothetical protein